MSVRIRMKKLGRRHQPFFRICAVDQRAPRDGRVLEELGTYDPRVNDLNARAILNAERISYWLGVGAQPSDNVRVLIKKYGKDGTHLDQQKAALEQLAQPRVIPDPGTPVLRVALPKAQESPATAPADEPPSERVTEGADESPPVEASAEDSQAAVQPSSATDESSVDSKVESTNESAEGPRDKQQGGEETT